MTKHVYWTCDGCGAEANSAPATITISLSGTIYDDRKQEFQLCGQCISRVSSNMPWPDQREQLKK